MRKIEYENKLMEEDWLRFLEIKNLEIGKEISLFKL